VAAPPHHHHQQQKAANLARTFTKLLRRKRVDAAAQGGAPEAPASVAGDDGLGEERTEPPPAIPSLSKLKLSGNLAAAYSFDAFFRNAAEKKAGAAAGGGTGSVEQEAEAGLGVRESGGHWSGSV